MSRTVYNNEYWSKGDGIKLITQWKRNGCTNEEIAKNIGITVKTLYEWKKDNVILCEALKITREASNTELENKAYEMAMNGNTAMMMFLLKNRISSKYKDRQEVSLDANKEAIESIKTLGDNLVSE